ncbi:unannotated protein [freshwater metagenome]|uniref:Unannotated protein n=1 Tax=freshwater metagenome TaxID=449393 RepID=A0A6J6YK67_9ZZZZ
MRFAETSLLPHTAQGSHSAGATPAKINDVALTPPTIWTVIAMSAGYLQPPFRNAKMVNASSHGRPAQGKRITDIRAA